MDFGTTLIQGYQSQAQHRLQHTFKHSSTFQITKHHWRLTKWADIEWCNILLVLETQSAGKKKSSDLHPRTCFSSWTGFTKATKTWLIIQLYISTTAWKWTNSMDKKGEVLAGPTWVLLCSNSFSICFGKNLATVKNKFTEQPIVCLTTRKLVPWFLFCFSVSSMYLLEAS